MYRAHYVSNASEAADFIVQAGMLPFLKSAIDGFSLQDHVPQGWFESDDHELNPWYWRYSFALDDQIAYGKFFNRKLGFVAKELFADFVNVKRNGRAVQQFFEDGLISGEAYRLYESFFPGAVKSSLELREDSGLKRSVLDRALAELMNETLIVILDFQQRIGRNGRPYGWPIAYYGKPEEEFGEELVFCHRTKAQSWSRLMRSAHKIAQIQDENQMLKVLGIH